MCLFVYSTRGESIITSGIQQQPKKQKVNKKKIKTASTLLNEDINVLKNKHISKKKQKEIEKKKQKEIEKKKKMWLKRSKK